MSEAAKRYVVVGASTGLGRCVALGLAADGDRVAMLARRKDLLDDAVAEAGPGTYAIACDVSDEESCRTAVTQSVEALGGIDGLVYCPATAKLSRIEEVAAADWQGVFATNVTGAAVFTAAALPYLVESYGSAIYLSSVIASFTDPWPGLATYSVSKAALDKLVEAWRAEHPEVGFTRLVVGDCGGGQGHAGSHFINDWDFELLGELYPDWLNRGLLAGRIFDVEELVHTVGSILRIGASATIPSATIVPRQTKFARSIINHDAAPVHGELHL